jgi:alpha-tubulin suppressor-like RCC1 family protein
MLAGATLFERTRVSGNTARSHHDPVLDPSGHLRPSHGVLPMKLRSTLLAATCGLLAACADGTPLASRPGAAPPPTSQRFECTVYVHEQRVACTTARPAGVRGALIGGQGQYVNIISSNVVWNAGTRTVSTDVAVQNLLPIAMGTLDGVSPDPAGVRVFFYQGPTVTSGWGGVTVQNPDGVATFTAANQPYFQYSPLAPGQTSSAKPWQFQLDADAEYFSFTVLVAAHTAPTLAISEIMAHPSAASEPAGEWFEVYNASLDPVDLQGWTIASGGDTPHTITGSLVVGPRGYVVLGGSTSTAANGGASVRYAYAGIDLANGTGDWLALRSPAGFTADSVDWGAAPGETATAPPAGSSLELDSLKHDNTWLSGAGSHWAASAVTFGTGQQGTPGSRRLVPFTAVSVAAGYGRTCAVDTAGQAWCWGAGELGNPDTTQSAVPLRVRQPAGVVFTQVETGPFSTCALATTGQAYCWGAKVPVGTSLARRQTPVAIPQPAGVTFTSLSKIARTFLEEFEGCGIDASGQAWCWGFRQFTPALLAAPAPVAQVSIGQVEICIRSTAGNVYCRTTGAGADSFVAVRQPGVTFQWMDTSDRQGCGISTIGQMMCWQAPSYAVSIENHPPTVRFGSVVVSGPGTRCGLATSGQAYCRGINNYGQLGDGTKTTRTTLTPVSQPPGVLFSTLTLSEASISNNLAADHACALGQTSGVVYCWGGNQNGELGDGTTTERLVPVPVYR